MGVRPILGKYANKYRQWRLKRLIRKSGGTVKGIVDISGTLTFGKGITISGKGIDTTARSQIFVCKGANLYIGDYSGITQTSIYCKRNIHIGKYVKIGAGCLIMDSNFHSLNWKHRMDSKTDNANTISTSVIIEDHAFIGARSIICKGVRIGERSIIAAGSVVTKNIPEGEIWGGNPAIFIRKI